MKTIAKLLIALGMVSLSVAPALAGNSAFDDLKAFLAKTKTMSANFSQLAIAEYGQAAKASAGKFLLAKPGKFRWEYTEPHAQTIVSDGKKVWHYDVDLEQVTATKLDNAIGSTPALLLSGNADLEENFAVLEQDHGDDMSWLRLTPKSDEAGFKYILIGLRGQRLGGMELSDNFGQLTRIDFSDVEINGVLDPTMFEFVVPDGVDVFENN